MTTRETIAWTQPAYKRLLETRGLGLWKKDSGGNLGGIVIYSKVVGCLLKDKRSLSDGGETPFVAQLPGVEGMQDWVLVIRYVNGEVILAISCDDDGAPWLYSLTKIDRKNLTSYFAPNEKIEGSPRFIANTHLLDLVLDGLTN